MEKPEKKNKHMSIPKAIIEVLDDHAEKTQRKQTVIYEMALKEYIIHHENDIREAGVDAQKVAAVIGK